MCEYGVSHSRGGSSATKLYCLSSLTFLDFHSSFQWNSPANRMHHNVLSRLIPLTRQCNLLRTQKTHACYLFVFNSNIAWTWHPVCPQQTPKEKSTSDTCPAYYGMASPILGVHEYLRQFPSHDKNPWQFAVHQVDRHPGKVISWLSWPNAANASARGLPEKLPHTR